MKVFVGSDTKEHKENCKRFDLLDVLEFHQAWLKRAAQPAAYIFVVIQQINLTCLYFPWRLHSPCVVTFGFVLGDLLKPPLLFARRRD